MRARWLGWAGVELETDEGSLVIDPIERPEATWAWTGDRAAEAEYPTLAGPAREDAVAGLVTHLHRDHADAGALTAALAPGAPVLRPAPGGGETLEEAGLLQAERDLSAAGLEQRQVAAWQTVELGPFRVTALPAVDGSGDPQLSWLVEADGAKVVHCGDTLFHGYWWRIAPRHGPIDVAFLPVNGAVVDFPHRQPPSPLPAVLDAEHAVIAARALGARVAVPIHHGGFRIVPHYEPDDAAVERFGDLAAEAALDHRILAVGDAVSCA